MEPTLNVLPHLIPHKIMKKKSFFMVKDKDRNSGGININRNLHCTHCAGWKATTLLDWDDEDFWKSSKS